MEWRTIFVRRNSKWKRVSRISLIRKGEVFKLREPDGTWFQIGEDKEFLALENLKRNASPAMPIKSIGLSCLKQDLFIEVYKFGEWWRINSMAPLKKGNIFRFKWSEDKPYFEADGTTEMECICDAFFKDTTPYVKYRPYIRE